MKKWLIVFVLILFIALTPCSALGLHNNLSQEKQLTDNKQELVSSCNDFNSLVYKDNLSLVPVRFIGKLQDDGRLNAIFESKLMVERLEFFLPKDLEHAFYETSGDWNEEISRPAFLKKIKKDFWLITYLTPSDKNSERIICSAHQIKNWDSLRANFAQDKEDAMKTVDTLAFWLSLRLKTVIFTAGKGETFQWASLKVVQDGPEFDKALEDYRLEHNQNGLRLIVNFNDGSKGLVIERGNFGLDKNCVFYMAIVKTPLIKVAGIGKSKVMHRFVSRPYFLDNFLKFAWVCVYDEISKNLVQVIGISPDDIEVKDKKTKK